MALSNRVEWCALLFLAAFFIIALSVSGQTLEEKIDSFLQPILKEDLISGTILIGQKGEIIFSKGYGPADREHSVPNSPETAFRLGSMSKQFTAAAILILEEKGELSVNDPLSKYYPDFPGADQITLHQLLNHTSGLANFSQGADSNMFMFPHTVDQVIESLKDIPLQSAPGEKFAYSNAGYIILAGVIEKVSGEKYAVFLENNIFKPLGMSNTGQDVYEKIVPHRAEGYICFGPEVTRVGYRDMLTMSGAGSLFSTPHDMFLWDQALCSDKILSAASRQKTFTAGQGNYGYGWFIEDRAGHKAISHRGEISGFIGSIDRYVDDSLVVIALFNFESTFARAVIRGLSDIALGREPKPLLVATPAAVDSITLNKYAGIYLFGPVDTMFVKPVESGLILTQSGNTDSLPAEPQNNNLFWIRGMNAMLKFDFGADSTIAGLTLINSVNPYRAIRVK